MSGTTEAFARVRIDALLKDAGWKLTDGSSVLCGHTLPDGMQADYVLRDRLHPARPDAERGEARPLLVSRQARIAPLVDEFGVRLRDQRARASAKSRFGEALRS